MAIDKISSLGQSIPLPMGPIMREEIDPSRIGNSQNALPAIDLSDQMANGQHVFGLLAKIVSGAIKALPGRLKRDAVWLIPLAVIWLVIWPMKVMFLMKLPGFIASLIHIIIFLTATYNGFLGKAVFITVLSRSLVPLIKNSKKSGLKTTLTRYQQTTNIIKKAVHQNPVTALKTVLFSAGLALAVSVSLTRNNRIDKYFVCVRAAWALFDDLSRGRKNPVVILVLAALRDLPRLFLKKSNPTMRLAYLTITGFSSGLLLAFIPGMMNNSYTSLSGVYAGLVLIIAGLILHFTSQKPAKEPQKAPPSDDKPTD